MHTNISGIMLFQSKLMYYVLKKVPSFSTIVNRLEKIS